MYAEIINDVIVNIHNNLPKNYKNISNFFSLSDQELINLDWSGNKGHKFYPIETSSTPEYDPLYEISGPNYVIDNDNHKVVESWEHSAIEVEKAWDMIRQKRTLMLSTTDWTQLADSPLSEIENNRYIEYRQKLRDITFQPDPFNIEWPQL